MSNITEAVLTTKQGILKSLQNEEGYELYTYSNQDNKQVFMQKRLERADIYTTLSLLPLYKNFGLREDKRDTVPVELNCGYKTQATRVYVK